MRVTCDRVDGEWLDAQLAELRRLVEAGDTLELVSRLSSVVGQAQRAPAERRQRASAQAAPGAAEGAELRADERAGDGRADAAGTRRCPRRRVHGVFPRAWTQQQHVVLSR
jgi:hypothetical protein